MTVSGTSRTRLFTAFGTVLYVEPTTGELRHGPIESSLANAFFEVDENAEGTFSRGRLVHEEDGLFEPIVCCSDICLLAPHSQRQNRAANPTLYDVVPLERGLLALRSNGLFLSAIPDGFVRLRAEVCSTWELFLASESWCSAGHRSHAWRSDASTFDKSRIENYIVHPLIRARTGRRPQARKILIYGYTRWSHGRVYYDLCRHLSERGYVIDLLDWQVDHAAYVEQILPYYELVISAPDGIPTLVDKYRVPYEKIIALSHSELDLRMLIESKGSDVFDKFANYGVVSEAVYSASIVRGIRRLPNVVPLAIDYDSFFSPLPEQLARVGYATSMSLKIFGVEFKRGELAEAAVKDAGLEFRIAGSTANQISFHEMPKFYRSVDAVVVSSVNESGPLSVMEGAAAGRLVIGTPVGHFPLKAYLGGGILAPIEPEKFKAFTTATLRYYKDNPAAFVDQCHTIREAARKFDWKYAIDDWIELFECEDRAGTADKLPPLDKPTLLAGSLAHSSHRTEHNV